MREDAFQCSECSKFVSGPSMHYKNVSQICKDCLALFLSINRATMGAKW